MQQYDGLLNYILSGEGAMALTGAFMLLIVLLLPFSPPPPAVVSSNPVAGPISPRGGQKEKDHLVSCRGEDDDTHHDQNHHAARHQMVIQTCFGEVHVTRLGVPSSHANILTVHEMGMNHRVCFQPFFAKYSSTRPFSMLCVYHVDFPGVQDREENSIGHDVHWEDVVKVIEQIREECAIQKFLAWGVGLGSDVLLRYATQYPQHVQGMILFGPTRQPSSLAESCIWTMMRYTILYFGPCSSLFRSAMAKFLFSGNFILSNPKLIEGYLQGLSNMRMDNFLRVMQAYKSRLGIRSYSMKIIADIPKLLVVAGQPALPFPFLDLAHDEECAREILQMSNLKTNSWLKIPNSGRLIAAERSEEIVAPIKYFLNGLGFV